MRIPAYLPENFDADLILESYTLSMTRQRNIKACLYYILDTLHHLSLNRQYREIYESTGGYPLHSPVMNEIMGKSYLLALNILEENEVIVRSCSYQNGQISKIVRLTSSYISTGKKVRNIDECTPVGKKLIQRQKELSKQQDNHLEKIGYITKWFDPSRISVDKDLIHPFIEFYRKYSNEQIKRMYTGRHQSLKNRINARYNHMVADVESLLRKEMRLARSGSDYRLHSFLSNMKKESRQFISYDAQPLVSIDIKSSQLYFFNFVLNPGNFKLIHHILSLPTYSSIPTYYITLLQQYILMFGNFTKSIGGRVFQGVIFENIDWKRGFYQCLVDRAKRENCHDLFPNEAQVKRKMFNLLFTKEDYIRQDDMYKKMSIWYPNEIMFIEAVHSLSRKLEAKHTQSPKFRDTITNVLPVLLQRVESHLLLDHICKKISVELPDAPLLPVHDCIHTTPQYAQSVQYILERELTSFTGVVPGIEMDYYSKEAMTSGIKEVVAKSCKKLKGNHKTALDIPLVAPLMPTIPRLNGASILSTRYVTAFEGE